MVIDERPLLDLVAESERVLEAARDARVPIRLTGGLAIRRRHPSATHPPLARTYADMDLAASSKTTHSAITALMVRLGYTPDQMFNSLHGNERLYYEDMSNGRHVDVFVDAVRMCHVIPFKGRLQLLDDTLPVSDLLLTKLQIFQLNRKDLLDILAVLHDQTLRAGANDALDPGYLAGVWGNDWPIWRTSRRTLDAVRPAASEILDPAGAERVLKNLEALEDILVSGPKSLRWKLRAQIGERVRWYELPEEVGQ